MGRFKRNFILPVCHSNHCYNWKHYSSFGNEIMKNRIKELRKQHGYRQEDLAEALKVSRQTIIAIENDKYNPTLESAMKLARYLNTTVE